MDIKQLLLEFQVEIALDSVLLEKSLAPLNAGIDGCDWFKSEREEDGRLDILKLRDSVSTVKIDTHLNLKFGLHALGSAYIICFSEFLKKVAKRRMALALNARSVIRNDYDLWVIGPKIGNAFWANAVIAASNYVRHYEEWHKIIQIDSVYLVNGKVPNVVDWGREIQKLEPKAQRNVSCLSEAGVNFEDFLTTQSRAGFEIVRALNLLEGDSGIQLFESWCEAVVDQIC